MLSVSRFYSARMFSQSFRKYRIILKPDALQSESAAKHFIQLALKNIMVHNCTYHWHPAQPLWQLSEDHFDVLVPVRENPTPAGRIRFFNQGNTCPCVLKLDYTSALFCLCTFHTFIFFSKPSFLVVVSHFLQGCNLFFSHPWVERGRRMEQDVREERWPCVKASLWSEGGFLSLVMYGLLPWHGAMGNLSPYWEL